MISFHLGGGGVMVPTVESCNLSAYQRADPGEEGMRKIEEGGVLAL